MNVAVLYIGIGRYTVFWDLFFDSCLRFFLPEAKKHFFYITDIPSVGVNKLVTVVPAENCGWPMITLRRFEFFNSIRSDLAAFDYIFFFNGNAQFLRVIHPDEFLPAPDQGIVACSRQTGKYVERRADTFPFERNPLSQSYVPFGTIKKYHQGGIMGGLAQSFLDMVETCRNMVCADLDKGIIPVWHDESVFNKYLLTHPYRELSSHYLFAPRMGRFWWRWNPKIKILLRDKNQHRYGGHKWLRGLSDEPQSVSACWLQNIRDVIGR
ncbi:MAG: hypothetical protein PHX41_05175 [Kiritimatiellae bacterium]|nr:hypothetical protein [Kiritimatiellia bacterium]